MSDAHDSPPNDDKDSGATRDADATAVANDVDNGSLSFGAKVRYTIYALLLAAGIILLVIQLTGDDRNWIIAGLYEATPEQLRDASTPEAPIYWLGPNALPGDEFVTYTLSDKEKGLATNVRGAVLYLPPDQAEGAVGDGERPLTTFASVYTRPLNAGARQALERARKACDAGKCLANGSRVATRFGPAYVETSPSGGWIGRVAIDDHSLVIVSAGNNMKKVDTFNSLYPIDGEPPSPVTAVADDPASSATPSGHRGIQSSGHVA